MWRGSPRQRRGLRTAFASTATPAPIAAPRAMGATDAGRETARRGDWGNLTDSSILRRSSLGVVVAVAASVSTSRSSSTASRSTTPNSSSSISSVGPSFPPRWDMSDAVTCRPVPVRSDQRPMLIGACAHITTIRVLKANRRRARDERMSVAMSR